MNYFSCELYLIKAVKTAFALTVDQVAQIAHTVSISLIGRALDTVYETKHFLRKAELWGRRAHENNEKETLNRLQSPGRGAGQTKFVGLRITVLRWLEKMRERI